MGNAIRMRDRDTIEVAVDGRSVVIAGELAVEGARKGFWLETSTRWRWADGRPMADAERSHLVEVLPTIGIENGWELWLDEGPWQVQLPITASFEFRGFDTLVFKAPGAAATVPGRLTIDRGEPHFTIDVGRRWTTPDGELLSAQEVARIADVIRREAPANRVTVATTGRPSRSSDLT